MLLIENELPLMKLMAWALREEGYVVDVTTTDRAPERAGVFKPAVIIFNTNCVAAEKRACIERLRAAHPATVVDLAEGATNPRRDTGADAYLDTPVSVEHLKAAIERLSS